MGRKGVFILALLLMLPLGFAHAGDDLALDGHGGLGAMQEHHDEMHAGAGVAGTCMAENGVEGGCEMASYYGYGMGDMMGGGFFGLGWIGALFFILVIAAILYLLFKALQEKPAGDSQSPAEILRKRFAKGEITKQQFEEMKKELSK